MTTMKRVEVFLVTLSAIFGNVTADYDNGLVSKLYKQGTGNNPLVLILDNSQKSRADDREVHERGYGQNVVPYVLLQGLKSSGSAKKYNRQNDRRFRDETRSDRDREDRSYWNRQRVRNDRSFEHRSDRNRGSERYNKRQGGKINERKYSQSRHHHHQRQEHDRTDDEKDILNQNRGDRVVQEDRGQDRWDGHRHEEDRHGLDKNGHIPNQDRRDLDDPHKDRQMRRDKDNKNVENNVGTKLRAREQVPVVKHLLRTVSCNARDECHDECASEENGWGCDEECDEKYECEESEEVQGSTKAYKFSNENVCKRC